jgi:hypothetical protein
MAESVTPKEADRHPVLRCPPGGIVFAVVVFLISAGAVGFGTGIAPSRAAVSQTLNAGFDADGDIYLTFADGTPIGAPTAPGTVIPAGTYTIGLNNNSLDDLGNPHEFHLFGPGVNLAAGTAVQATWTATFLPASTYVFQDDLNPTTVHEVFGTPGSGATSTTVPATTTTSPPVAAPSGSKPSDDNPVGSGIVPFRGTLIGAVSKAGKLTLTDHGKTVSTLETGRYTITVSDKSSKAGFMIQEIRRAASTVGGVGFVGKHSVTLDLKPGQWFFYSTFVGRKSYFIVVS